LIKKVIGNVGGKKFGQQSSNGGGNFQRGRQKGNISGDKLTFEHFRASD